MSYRSLYRLRSNLLIIGFIFVPRFTLLYLYFYENGTTFYPLISKDDINTLFWLCFMSFPNLTCIYYVLDYYWSSQIIVILFIIVFIYKQENEIFVICNSRLMLEYWFIEVLIAIVLCILELILPFSISNTFLFLYIIVIFFSFFIWTHKIMHIIYARVRLNIELMLRNNDQSISSNDSISSRCPHFPIPLNIPKLLSNIIIPKAYKCPITLEIMSQPTITSYGYTYEYAYIFEWVEKNKNDPITKQPLNTFELIPNRAIRDAIEQWINKKIEQ